MLHPRNRHQGRYDFPSLMETVPELKNYVAKNQYGDLSLDFTNAEAVKCLNRALLKKFYGIKTWDIPQGYLCPPIPGRADYIHLIADLVGKQGKEIKGLDIGVGANCIYPIIGHCEYGWSFVGSDINPLSLQNAALIVKSNPELEGAIQFRLQTAAEHIFKNVILKEDHFHFTLCNPPFHSSLEEAQKGSRRKWKNLDKDKALHEKQLTNFGGQGAELWCKNGELSFIQTMIQESTLYQKQCDWFSTLVSKKESLIKIDRYFKEVGVKEHRTLPMSQGQKKSRIIAWHF